MKIITCITDKNQVGYVHALKASCEYFNLELVTLTIDNYVSHRQKTKCLKEYLETINLDELVLFTDGYDTIFVGGENEIITKYTRLSPKGQVLMSGDRFCAPDRKFSPHFKKLKMDMISYVQAVLLVNQVI